MSQRPDFFIVGAPKCGTTAMYEYLRAHPQVFMPSRKEPHHFGRDIRSDRFVNERRAYLALFAEAGDARAVGEASVWSLRSRYAAAEIQEFAPEARILIMLRDPVELIRSLHAHNVANGIEDLTDIREAIDAAPDRGQRRHVGRPTIPEYLDYRGATRFSEQLARFAAAFPAARRHVIVLERFTADPEAGYRGVARFLGVDETFRPAFDRLNAARSARSAWVARWLYAPPPSLQHAFRRVVPGRIREQVWRAGLRRSLLRLNTSSHAPPPMPDGLRRRLRAEYRDEIRATAEAIGDPSLTTLWSDEDQPTA